MAKEMMNLAFEVSLFILQGEFLHANGFTSSPKEGMLWIFIALGRV
jgi:hypothetical protein